MSRLSGVAVGGLVSLSVVLAALAGGSRPSPDEADVCIEIESTEDASFPTSVKSFIEWSFAERGYRIRFFEGDQNLPFRGTATHEDWRELVGGGFSQREDCYHLLIVNEWTGDPIGGIDPAGHGNSRGYAVVEQLGNGRNMASLTMHELGHAAGMGVNSGHEGVDSWDYSVNEYRSVMNLNGLYDLLTYSDGQDVVGRDEWEMVATGPHPGAITPAASTTR